MSEPRYWVKGHKRYPFKRLSAKYGIDSETGRVNIKSSFMPHLIAAKDRVMQVGRWKLIWHAMKKGHKVELFDRETDPTNTTYRQHPRWWLTCSGGWHPTSSGTDHGSRDARDG